jgi:hypothetical protein
MKHPYSGYNRELKLHRQLQLHKQLKLRADVVQIPTGLIEKLKKLTHLYLPSSLTSIKFVFRLRTI